MPTLSNIKLGARLAAGFGVVLTLMAVMIALAVQRTQTIGGELERIVTKDWVKADAVASIDALTRANARRTMELFFVADAAEAAQVGAKIAGNRAQIDAHLATLERLVYTPAGKELLQRVSAARAAYVRSFTEVAKALESGARDQASAQLKRETLPAIDRLQGEINALATLQRTLVEQAGAHAGAAVDATRWLLLAFGAVALAAGAAMAWWLTRSIVRPLRTAVQVADAVAAGELGSCIEVHGRDETAQLLAALKAMNGNLVDIVGQVRTSSDSIATGSSQIATGNADLSQRTEEQASNLQQTAASMEQLHSTIRQNADTAQQACQIAGAARDAALQGGQVVGQVVATMQEITASSRRIGDIIGVIDGIAFQTNILALNAAVEAARAGEQGRGFAVVAAEVRSLAQRSAEAAREIKSLIGASADRVENGARQVAEAGQTMERIVGQVRRVADMIGEISAASVEQTTGIGQVNDAVAQLDQVTQQNAALVEESAAAAESLRQQAQRLVQAVSVFRLDARSA